MKTFGNILWLIFGGFFSAIGAFLEGILCFVSLIFIPVGFQQFKLAKFFLWPMGKKVINVKPSGCDILPPLIEAGVSCSMTLTSQAYTSYPDASHP